MKILTFRDLDAWKVAMDMTVALYPVIGQLPPCERFELASQMRRAAVSIPSNVAEGQATGLPGRNRHHEQIALGSVGELTTCVELCRRLGYIDSRTADRIDGDLTRTRQLLHGLLRSIRLNFSAKVLAAIALAGAWWTVVRSP